jgi:aryl-alcohol dehydrogenase-like predicted oxidoreductase
MDPVSPSYARRLGDRDLFAVGMGCMPLSQEEPVPAERANAAIHAALDAGVTLFDTADAYAPGSDVGHNERVLARALRAYGPNEALVATKGGHTRPGGGWEIDASPEHLRTACEASLRALGTDCIDLYQLHRPDPEVPYADSVGALRDLRDEGKVRLVGLSNATVAQLEEAERIVEIAAVQNQLSLSYTGPLGKGEVAACAERGIPFLAWSPLGGIGAADTAGSVQAVRRVAERHGVSPQRVALAWLLSLGPTVVPIPGASRPESIADSAAAAWLELSGEELAEISSGATGR